MVMTTVAMALGGALVWFSMINAFNLLYLACAGGSFLLGIKWAFELIRISRMLAEKEESGQADDDELEDGESGDIETLGASGKDRMLGALNDLKRMKTDDDTVGTRRTTVEDYMATSPHEGFDTEDLPVNSAEELSE